jgi:chromosome segregation ATPase
LECDENSHQEQLEVTRARIAQLNREQEAKVHELQQATGDLEKAKATLQAAKTTVMQREAELTQAKHALSEANVARAAAARNLNGAKQTRDAHNTRVTELMVAVTAADERFQAARREEADAHRLRQNVERNYGYVGQAYRLHDNVQDMVQQQQQPQQQQRPQQNPQKPQLATAPRPII